MVQASTTYSIEEVSLRALRDEAGLFDEIMFVNRELSPQQTYIIAVLSSCGIAEVQRSEGADTRWQDVMGRALVRNFDESNVLPAPGTPEEMAELEYVGSHFQPTGKKPDTSAAGLLQMCFTGKFAIRFQS